MDGYIGLRESVFSTFLISPCACLIGDVLTRVGTGLKYTHFAIQASSVSERAVLSSASFLLKLWDYPFKYNCDYWLSPKTVSSKIQFNLRKSPVSLRAWVYTCVHRFLYTRMQAFIFTSRPSNRSPTFTNYSLLYLDKFHVAQPAGGGKI